MAVKDSSNRVLDEDEDEQLLALESGGRQNGSVSARFDVQARGAEEESVAPRVETVDSTPSTSGVWKYLPQPNGRRIVGTANR